MADGPGHACGRNCSLLLTLKLQIVLQVYAIALVQTAGMPQRVRWLCLLTHPMKRLGCQLNAELQWEKLISQKQSIQ